METMGLIMSITYFGLIGFVFSKRRREIDILKVQLKLLPFWFKFIGIGWSIFVVYYSYTNNWVFFSQNNFLFTGINLGLLLLAVSRDRIEDEFSNQIRLRSMYLSALTLFILAGVFLSGLLINPNSVPKNGIVYLIIIMDLSLFVYLTNYYLSKYLINK